MKRIGIKSPLLILLAAFLAPLCVTFAAQAMPFGPRGGGHGGMGGHDDAGFSAKMATYLNLTDAQKKQVEEITTQYKTQAEPQRKAAEEGRKKVKEAMHATPFDEGALRHAAKEAATAREELLVLRVRKQNSIKAVLTEEQRKKMAELKELFRPEGAGKEHRWGKGEE